MEIVVLDYQILPRLIFRGGVRGRWLRRALEKRVQNALVATCPAQSYLHILRGLTQNNEFHALQRLSDARRILQITTLNLQTLAFTERVRIRQSHLDLYNIASASIALARNVPLAVWDDAQYADLKRQEGLSTIDWSK